MGNANHTDMNLLYIPSLANNNNDVVAEEKLAAAVMRPHGHCRASGYLREPRTHQQIVLGKIYR